MSDIRTVAARLIRSHEAYVAEHGNPRIAPNFSTDAYTVARAVERLQSDNAALKATLATVAEERDGARTILNMLADRFDLSSWEFEQRWGTSWHDATDAEMAEQIRAALAAAAPAGEEPRRD